MITGVVLARNEESQIENCLRTFRPYVSELILIDMASADRTVDLARPLVDQILRHPLIPNFDAARNIAIAAAKYDWQWFLDADERVSPEAGELVRQLIRARGHEITAITIPFKTYFGGQWIQHCGWWPGYTMPRVLKRGHFEFGAELHSGVRFQGQEVRLAPDPRLAIEHFSYRGVEHYVEKFNRYTSTEALNLARRGTVLDWRQAVRAMVRDWWTYYECNEGGKDGLRGWILSWLAGQYRWFSHAKLSDHPDYQASLATAAVPRDLDEALAVMADELQRCRAVGGPPPRWAFRLRSPLFDPSGYADDGRALLKAAARSDRSVTAEEIRWSDTPCALPEGERVLLRSLLRGQRSWPEVAVTNCIPTLCQPDPRAEFNIIRTTFETDRFPVSWRPLLEAFDAIWVYSQFNAVSFRRGGAPPERLRVLPVGVDTDTFRPDGPRLPLPEPCANRFVFLSVFDWQLRKGWDRLLTDYLHEFSPADGTALLLKITRSHGYDLEAVRNQAATMIAQSGQSLSERADIVIWDEHLDVASLASLYRAVQAFVLPSRGEGWGRPYLEAMASGLPTIGTRGSGNMDFMNDSNSLLVGATWGDVDAAAAREIGVYAGHQWLEPDSEDLRRAMRWVFDERSAAIELGARAARDIQTNFSLPRTTEKLEHLLVEVKTWTNPPPPPARSAGQVGVALEGEFFAGHSFSNVNERLALGLINRPTLAVTLRRTMLNPTHDERVPHAHRVRPYFDRPLGAAPDVLIRHAFPPRWERPDARRWVHIQPWEFGALPRDWVRPLRDEVDEIWAPSHYVREVYERSGIDPAKIQVIPWGIDPDVYRPDVPALHLPPGASGRFCFLYCGGTVARKGFDLLLQAYLEEFSVHDPVALVIKDVGSRTFYRQGNYRELIQQQIASGAGPTLIYLDEEMTEGQRASLYAACHCLAAPYRGEGFGLPVLEAMACGLAPLVPQNGPTDDFVTDECGYRLPSRVVECPHDWRLCGPATELSIEIADLRAALRQAFIARQETRAKGQRASELVHEHWTWDQTLRRMEERLLALCPVERNSSVELASAPAPISHEDDTASAPALDATTVRVEECLPPRLDLTACLVTKNMEASLADCLATLRPYVREIVVHDLGSSDRTIPIAREYGARITRGTEGEFLGATRNVALTRATSEWILSLDGDERVTAEGLEALSAVLDTAAAAVLGIDCRVRSIAPLADGEARREVRVFRNCDGVHFEFRGGERVTRGIERLGGLIQAADVTIERVGPGLHDERRLFALIHQDLAESPGDPEVLWNLGAAHLQAGNFFHAECYLNECSERCAAPSRLKRDALDLLVRCYQRIGDDIRAEDCARRLSLHQERTS